MYESCGTDFQSIRRPCKYRLFKTVTSLSTHIITQKHLLVKRKMHARAKKVDEKMQKGKRFFKKDLTKGRGCAIISNANRKDASLLVLPAGVAEQADARDLKSRDARASYRFDPGHRHQGTKKNIAE